MFLIFLNMCLGLEVPMVTLCLTFWGSAKLFFKATAPLYMLTSNVWGFLSLHTSSSILVIICLLLIIVAMLVCVKWYFIVVLLYISLKISDVEHLLMSYWLFAYYLWRSIYANTLPSCKSGCLFPCWLVSCTQVPYQVNDLQLLSPIPWADFSPSRWCFFKA